MGRILDAIIDFFEKDSWPYSAVEDRPILKTAYEGKVGQFTCYAQAREEQQQFVFYAIFPVRAPLKKLPAVAEFINRANYGMIIGNFEMDYSDGEIRYKTSADLEDVTISEPLLRNLVYANVLTMDRYFSGLMRVLYADVTAEDAINEVEGGAGR